MAERVLRAGVAGAGFIGIVHARAYYKAQGVEVVAVADPVTDLADAVAKETGCVTFTDYVDMVQKADLDILSVCLPPTLHLPAAKVAAEAGVHILMEKPITRTLSEADEMVHVCKDAGVYLMTGFTHHFYPEMREAKRVIESGDIGTPMTVLDAMSLTYNFGHAWYRDREIAGGGVMMCNAVHGFDRVSWVLGQRIEAVSALVQPTEGTKGEEFGSALARFDGGVQGTFFQHWGPYRSVQCEMRVYGETGMIHVRSWDGIEILRGDERTTKQFYYPDSGISDRAGVGMLNEIQEMVNAINVGRQPTPTGVDGRNAIALVQAAYESSETGQWVAVTKYNG